MEREIELTKEEISALIHINAAPALCQTTSKILNDSKRLAQFGYITNDAAGLVLTPKGKKWLEDNFPDKSESF